MKLFKLTGMLIGTAFIFLAVWWRDDPGSQPLLIFFAGVLLILGSRHNIVNEERTNHENRS
jgi:hypothetical protein